MSSTQNFDGLDVHIHLAFVITGSASVDIAVANARLEGRIFPKLERIGRLNIVVTVAEHGGLAGSMQPISVDERVLTCSDQLNVFEARISKTFSYELGRTRDIGLVLGERADARDAQK